MTKSRTFSSSSRDVDNILSHVLRAVFQILKPPPDERSELYVAYKHTDLRLVGARRSGGLLSMRLHRVGHD